MRGLTRRHLLGALPPLALPLAAAASPGAYPDRPVVLVAPFSAGGAADIAARTLAAHAPRHLPNPAATIVVENRTGASGAIGTLHVARARPDGYTLLLARIASAAILPATDPRTPYAWDGFTMLGLLDENPYVVAVRADAPWRTLQELLATLRDHPGVVNFATTGPATILDLGVRHLFATAGLPIDAGIAIPFRGGGEAVAALLGGQVDFIGNNLSDTIGAIAGGQLRALVVSTRERLPSLPGVPTAKEAGVEALTQISGWNALFGPPGLPEPVIAAWTGALAGLAGDSAWLEATRRVGSLPRLLGPAETREFVANQVALYRELARRLGLG
ncbi:Bug family tripartite tricarboxylate transporter substrate binding protein [Crenalkalicoccus roseus]|uniref:Bug family tripartite tricarboxylate transporter substrate binding protein n=1 Tax=Crenalkalicoccus roseus TaxID=1485588 RepID=UPI00108220D2|nr:tripartite tricarboxylate transporter substrate binding protein [Crenalkalicoccus roseus]